MLQLYFFPMACSLASRIALMEAGVEARYCAVDIFSKKTAADGTDFRTISIKGAVPVLRLNNGELLTENAAVLQYIADLRPESGLAPPAGDPDRYRLQEWLSFVGTEVHKAFLFPSFWYSSDAARQAGRERIIRSLSFVAQHLSARSYLVGDKFTVADAYFSWALILMKRCAVDIADWPSLVDYQSRIRARPQVKAAIAIERQIPTSVPR